MGTYLKSGDSVHFRPLQLGSSEELNLRAGDHFLFIWGRLLTSSYLDNPPSDAFLLNSSITAPSARILISGEILLFRHDNLILTFTNPAGTGPEFYCGRDVLLHRVLGYPPLPLSLYPATIPRVLLGELLYETIPGW